MSRLARLAAAIVAPGLVIVLSLTCHKSPLDWNKFDLATIEQNLASLDSASSIYRFDLAAGDLSAAAQGARAYLLGQPGVDTVRISPDSTVWAFFENGLLAGLGNDSVGPEGRSEVVSEHRLEIQAGGEVNGNPQYILPFDQELPGTRIAADAIAATLQHRLGWTHKDVVLGSDVTIFLAKGLFSSGTSVLYWSGHGVLVPPSRDSEVCGGLETGVQYDDQEMARTAVNQCAGLLKPDSGPPLVAILHRARTWKYVLVILPAFVRAYGDFDKADSLPGVNYGKTVVHLSCCFSAYEENPELVQAFRDAGADVVSGWSWEVTDGFAMNKDTTYLSALADTCFPNEALGLMGNLTDPTELHGQHATFRMTGDTLVMLRAVLQAVKGGRLYRERSATAMEGGSSALSGTLAAEGDPSPSVSIGVGFPGSTPGVFDVTALDNAFITWTDLNSGRTYLAGKNDVGVSGHISIARCASDVIVGSFSGNLGYWQPPLDPTQDQPTEVIAVANGHIKYSGKIFQSGTSTAP